jgi:hypothetical protein
MSWRIGVDGDGFRGQLRQSGQGKNCDKQQ